MQIKTLYKYNSEHGFTVSPIQPECEYTTGYRIIADEGKSVTLDGELFPCVDVDDVTGWHEVEEVEE